MTDPMPRYECFYCHLPIQRGDRCSCGRGWFVVEVGPAVDCPRCGTTVELLDDGTMASHDSSWHIGAPPCRSSRHTPLDARDAVAVERTLRLIAQCRAPDPSSLGRVEVSPRALKVMCRQAAPGATNLPLPPGATLFGVPLEVNEDMPAGSWRAFSRDGKVVREGTI